MRPWRGQTWLLVAAAIAGLGPARLCDALEALLAEEGRRLGDPLLKSVSAESSAP